MGSHIVYDWSTSTAPPKWGSLAKIFYSGLPVLKNSHADIKDSVACICICHPSGNDEFTTISNLVAEKQGIQIIIRTSSDGRSGETHKKDGNLVVLQLKPTHDCTKKDGVTRKDWDTIILELGKPNIAEKIVEGDIPDNLKRFFEIKIPETLISLSILFQVAEIKKPQARQLFSPETFNKVFKSYWTSSDSTSAWNAALGKELKNGESHVKLDELLKLLRNGRSIPDILITDAQKELVKHLADQLLC